MSQITTHVLDTANGKPAGGIAVTLDQADGDNWVNIAKGSTNDDGRIPSLLPADKKLPPGRYRLHFGTADYFKQMGTKGFYPYVDVVFELSDAAHYHVPLLLSPFGYSTYRGS